MKGLFCMLIGFLTGSPTLHLDGEESSIQENSLTKTNSESVQTNDSQNKNTMPTSEDSSNSFSKDPANLSDNEASSSKESGVIGGPEKRPIKLSDMFSNMYLKMHEHEDILLKNEKENYVKTGNLPEAEDTYFDKVPEFRRNDHVNLANHIKSCTTEVSEESTSESINKRHIDDLENENVKNKIQKKEI